jgi:phosphoribosylformimino-5-aminoimidazole carboxamide ribotide isomerase
VGAQSFVVFPAIDILDGKCVRLMHGDYAQQTVYHTDPVGVAEQFSQLGASWVHVVDLDAAKDGHPVHAALIERIARSGVRVQYGGGVRTMADAQRMFSCGVQRVVVGTAAVGDTEFIQDLFHTYDSERIVIGIDARDGFVATQGWLETSQWRAEALAQRLCALGATQFVFTDIGRDGAMRGPNVEALRCFSSGHDGRVIASGGVSRIEDIETLRSCSDARCTGVIVGRALYTGAVSLRDALACAHGV